MAKRSGIIAGIKAVEEALMNEIQISKIFIQKETQNEAIKEIIALARKIGAFYTFVPKEKLNRIYNGNHQGIIAIASPINNVDIERLIPTLYEQKKDPLVVVLDKITDVRNFGAIVRSAQFFGVDAVIIPVKESAAISEDAVKTSAGALLKMNIAMSNDLVKTIKYLKDSGLRVVGASEKGKKNIQESDFNMPIAIVMGSESEGIEEKILKLCDEQIKIPMTGDFDSLNVSVAAGIAFYEVSRQRKIV